MKKYLKRHLIRGTILTLALLIWSFKPYHLKEDEKIHSRPPKYDMQITSTSGTWHIQRVDPDKYSGYQIATDPSMSLDSTVDAHMVTDGVDVHVNEGEYLKLVNCSGIRIGRD